MRVDVHGDLGAVVPGELLHHLGVHAADGKPRAIRGQNGLSTRYQPGDMAAAILALEWDVGLKPRAVLTSLGTLEFNYVDGRHCYDDGEAVLTASPSPDPTRTLRASGRICAIGKYVGLGFTPWTGTTGPTTDSI